MGASVLLETAVVERDEAAPLPRARKRFVVVYPRVIPEMMHIRRRETAALPGARVRFFPGVCSGVSFNCRSPVRRAIVTTFPGTSKWLLARVCPRVNLQVA